MSSTDAPSQSGSRASNRVRGALSIEWKLPLLITAVLAAGLAAFLGFTYFTLAHRSETVVRDRFDHASRLVASDIADAVAQRKATFDTAARDSAITRVLASASATRAVTRAESLAAVKVLARLVGGRDSLAVMLADTNGRTIASTGRPFPESIRVIDPETIAPSNTDDALGTVRVSPLVPMGNRTLFWLVAPVVVENRRAGYIFEPRWILGAPNAMRNLREMTREDLTLYTRNIDGTGWNYTPGVVASAPTGRTTTKLGVTYERAGVGKMIAEEAPIAGTPWLVVIDSPVRTLLARLKATVERLAWWSLLLLAAGAALSWAIGRRITQPLIALTSAADQVATGTYERPIPVTGNDEVGRLTSRFHEMAGQVTDARRELERRATDAQAVSFMGLNRPAQMYP